MCHSSLYVNINILAPRQDDAMFTKWHVYICFKKHKCFLLIRSNWFQKIKGDATTLILLNIRNYQQSNSVYSKYKIDMAGRSQKASHIIFEIMGSLIILKTQENKKISDMFSVIKSNNSNFLNWLQNLAIL